jgi:hypothetical protein
VQTCATARRHSSLGWTTDASAARRDAQAARLSVTQATQASSPE